MPRLLLAGALLILQRNLGPVGHPPHRLREINVLVLLDECEHVAALVAAEAMEYLAVGVDVETGSLLFVKRAEGDEIGPGALEGQVRPDHIHDVTGSADLLEGRRRKQAGHSLNLESRYGPKHMARNHPCRA